MHNLEAKYIQVLKEKQLTVADQSLRTPKEKTGFGYGQISGLYQGLLIAEQLFEELIGEESERR